MNPEQVVNSYFRAVEEGDVAAVLSLCHPAVEIWHSFNDQVSSIDQITAQLGAALGLGRLSYVVQEQIVANDRVLRRHRARFDTPTGKQVEFPIAVFTTVKNGLITRIDEYVDSAALARVMAAAPGVPASA